MKRTLKISASLIAFAFSVSLFADVDAISQVPPFNATSVATLGGNCTQQGSVLFQSANSLSKCLGAGGAGQVLISGGANADLSWSTVSGVGTVTSVALSLPSIFSVSGSPVTAAGTLTGTLANQNANLVFAGPSTGVPAAPTFRNVVGADFGSQSQNLFLASPDGSAGNPSFRSITADDLPSLVPSLANALTATGSTQGTALAITADFNVVTTTPVSSGVILPSGAVSGQTLEVKNSGANVLNVYPPSAQSVDGLAVNTAVTLATNGAARFTFDGTSNWISR